MNLQTLLFTVADNIATITLNRPDDANALNGQMAEELHNVSIECATNEAIRAIIVTGAGKMFCGGGDLNEFKAVADRQEAHLLKMAAILHTALIRLANIDAPVIMAVNGSAGGGGFSLALSGDYVLASEKAKFVSAYTASALTPDGSSTYYLAKHVGLLRAKELMLTNRVLTAQEACDWGIANKVVAQDELMPAALALAKQFATGPTKAYGGVKRLLNSAFSASMEEQLEKETQFISGTMRTHDAPHGLEAFLNKEKPLFKGK